LITTKTKAGDPERFEVRIYLVHDLVASDDADQADFDSLIDLIQCTIAPDTWGDAPGQGSIREYENPGSLIVSHDWRTQEQIARLLKGLRIAQATQDGDEKVLEQLRGDGEAAVDAKQAAENNAPDTAVHKPAVDR
jgi:hypothetical protein